MSRRKIGISPQSEVVDQLDDLVEECEDLRVSRSEIIEAILVAYFEANENPVDTTRELVVQLRDSESYC
jgi:metal-responsive CopG/Arc/MetJ family transcriptional regulator